MSKRLEQAVYQKRKAKWLRKRYTGICFIINNLTFICYTILLYYLMKPFFNLSFQIKKETGATSLNK